MATTTDFPGMLRNDDDNLHARLVVWLSELTAENIPASVRIHWKPTGQLSEELLDEVAVTALPSNAAMLVEEVRKKVTDRLGPQPEGGALRVRAARKGQKATPDVDMSRRLAGGAVDNDANVAMVKAENDRLRNENGELRRQNVALVQANTTMGGSLSVLVGKQSETIGVLGTTRATAAAADEFSGIMTMIGLWALYQFFPLIKERMGLRPTAQPREVMEAVTRMFTGEGAPEGRPSPPPGAARTLEVDSKPTNAAPGAAPATAPTPTPSLSIADEVEAIITRFRNDERFRFALARRIGGDSELQDEMKNAAIAAVLSGAPA